MLPTEDAIAVGRLLAERFGLPHWQVATTATDANRFALRVARAVTGRRRILVFNGCYHGTVDETFVRLVAAAPFASGLLGQITDLTQLASVVEFNDVHALAAALSHRDVACVITEPVLTNSCMVLPEPGFHDEVRRLTRETGTLLLIDETHTISTATSCVSPPRRQSATSARAPASSAIDEEFTEKLDLHIHVPAAAIPKDGPSAGITMATALASALIGCPVRRDLAMTGEITLRGHVLPIGGLKEKLLAAHRAGIKTVLIPKENVRDIELLPPHVTDDMQIVPVESMDEVLDRALDPAVPAQARARDGTARRR